MDKKPSILVVDDMPQMLAMYSAMLTARGFSVLTASNGKAAIALAAKEKPDLVLLDVMMPKMDGGAVAAALLEDKHTRDIPIIFLTSIVSEKEVISRDCNIGGREFLSKSSPPNDIVAKIRQVLALP